MLDESCLPDRFLGIEVELEMECPTLAFLELAVYIGKFTQSVPGSQVLLWREFGMLLRVVQGAQPGPCLSSSGRKGARDLLRRIRLPFGVALFGVFG